MSSQSKKRMEEQREKKIQALKEKLPTGFDLEKVKNEYQALLERTVEFKFFGLTVSFCTVWEEEASVSSSWIDLKDNPAASNPEEEILYTILSENVQGYIYDFEKHPVVAAHIALHNKNVEDFLDNLAKTSGLDDDGVSELLLLVLS